MKVFSFLALATALCLALDSCVPVSDNPLSSIDNAHADPALVGDWRDDGPDTYRITLKQGPWMQVIVTPKQPDNEGRPSKIDYKPETFDFFPTVINSQTFANIVLPNKDAAGHVTKTYMIIRYTVSKNLELKIWSMSLDKLAAAVRAGKLKGNVREDESSITTGSPPHHGVDVKLTDTSENLAKYIQTADLNKLFTNLDTLTSIKTK